MKKKPVLSSLLYLKKGDFKKVKFSSLIQQTKQDNIKNEWIH